MSLNHLVQSPSDIDRLDIRVADLSCTSGNVGDLTFMSDSLCSDKLITSCIRGASPYIYPDLADFNLSVSLIRSYNTYLLSGAANRIQLDTAANYASYIGSGTSVTLNFYCKSIEFVEFVASFNNIATGSGTTNLPPATGSGKVILYQLVIFNQGGGSMGYLVQSC
jgi:hypothetical protein